MTLRSFGAIAGLVLLAIASSWGVSRWRLGRETPSAAAWSRALSPAGVPGALEVLDTSRAYRGVLAAPSLIGARTLSPREVEVELDPRALAVTLPEGRAHPSLVSALPSVARGRIAFDAAGGRITESWRLACPAGCGLDLLDRDPREGAPSAAWSVRPRACRALAWFALDARRLDDPALGGEGLAPLRARVEAVERLLGRSLRAELAEGLGGTGIVAVEDRGRLLIALDLKRADKVRTIVDLFVSLAVVAGRGEVLHHRDVPVAIVGAGLRGAAVAIDGPLLLLSDEAAAVTAAIDRRRAAGASASEPPPGFDGFRGSWRAERTSPSEVSASLTRDGVWWWLRGEGTAPAIAADPVLPYLQAWLAGTSGRRAASH